MQAGTTLGRRWTMTRLCLILSLNCVLAVPLRIFADETGAAPTAAAPLEQFQFRDDKGKERLVEGKIQVTAQDGGLLVLSRDGGLWTVEPSQLIKRLPQKAPFSPLAAADLGKQLVRQQGGGFQGLTTKHYVICFDTSRDYAQWCGALFERLFAGFYNFWKQRGIELREPEFPLVVIIFANEKAYASYSSHEVGADGIPPYGYYFISSNRIVLYDQTASGGKPARTTAEIQRRFAASPANIATVVHEATHQIAFNSGLHTRYADNPLWLTEGMAMYFETPDLQNRAGWKTIGAVNSPRLRQFRGSVARRSPGRLASLLESDSRFTTAETQGEAYAEAWALTYFLIRTRKEAYVGYLRKIAGKPVLTWDKPARRLEEFRAAFGEDLGRLEKEFLRYIQGLP